MSKKVLFINNTTTSSIIPEFLTEAGFMVQVAHDGEKGLQLLDADIYNLIILVERPYAESWRMCEKMRQQTTIPLIVISANASTETCVQAINAGADFFVRKPFGPLELLARVNTLLQRSSARQALNFVS